MYTSLHPNTGCEALRELGIVVCGDLNESYYIYIPNHIMYVCIYNCIDALRELGILVCGDLNESYYIYIYLIILYMYIPIIV